MRLFLLVSFITAMPNLNLLRLLVRSNLFLFLATLLLINFKAAEVTDTALTAILSRTFQEHGEHQARSSQNNELIMKIIGSKICFALQSVADFLNDIPRCIEVARVHPMQCCY